jgi:hypothetical protein
MAIMLIPIISDGQYFNLSATTFHPSDKLTYTTMELTNTLAYFDQTSVTKKKVLCLTSGP